MVEWMDSERMASDYLKNIDWKTFDLSQVSPEEMDTIQEEVGKFLMLHTRAELYKGAIERSIMLVPIATAEDVAGDRQLADRAYWIEMDHPELGAHIVYPGLWAKTNQPLWTAWRRAPLIGEHNQEVYENELGLSKEELRTLKESNVI
jgi:crotonobetainyl-CoA:carnitine CoA-transferase CaiB-like acyl-CoA transferase